MTKKEYKIKSKELLDKAWEILGEKGEDHIIHLLSRSASREMRLILAAAYINGAIEGKKILPYHRKVEARKQVWIANENTRKLRQLIRQNAGTRLR